MFRFIAFTLLCFLHLTAAEAEKPDIVLVFADDLGWQEPAYAGSDFCETPHLDRLVADGMVFRHAYASAGNCQPSRACMLSGQYTPRHDVYAVGRTKRGPVELMRLLAIANKGSLSMITITMGEAIKAAGYATGLFGKCHLKATKDRKSERAGLRKVCPEHGSFESTDVQKAFAYSSDLLVELSDDELSALNHVDDKIIVIDRFFSPDRLDPTLLAGRTLFLAPASLAAQHAFHLLKAAFDQKKTWALGQTVFSRKRQLVVIHSRDEKLLLHTLHDPALRRMPVSIQPNGQVPSRSDIRKLAGVMVDRGGPIPWSDYRDDSQERLAALVASKVGTTSNGRNGKTKTPATTEPKRQRRARAAAKAA